MNVVQFTTKKTGIPINWKRLKSIGKLYTLIDDLERVKIVTGPFKEMSMARKRVAEIRQLGYKDAFVKKINARLLHEVSSFELGEEQVKRGLNSVVEAIFKDAIPQNYEVISAKLVLANYSANVAPKLPKPNIRAKVKRTAALDIQKVLKTGQYYKGSLDGFYGKGTVAAYQKFEENDFQFKKYELLASYYSESSKLQSTDFQILINDFPYNPIIILPKLESSKEPLAKAYRAYWLLVNGGDIVLINNLMNGAKKEIFAQKKLKNSPPFDFNASYSYDNLEQLILHLRYMHAAPKSKIDIPCWLFERHPKEIYAAFNKKSTFPSFANTKIGSCESFDDWKSLKIMNTIIDDLQPSSFSKEELSRKATMEAGRSFLYLFPNKLNKKEKKETEKWLTDFWTSLEQSGKINPVLEKRLPTLKVLFFQSQVLLEDFYMNKNFTPDQAEGLALSVLKTYVDVPLGIYVN